MIYFIRLCSLIIFPFQIIRTKTALTAKPTNAAEIKQFWYPIPSNHGVMLFSCQWSFSDTGSVGGEDSPISNGKTHRISDDDHTRHAIPTQISIGIDEIIDTQRDARSIAECRAGHSHQKAKPVDPVRSANTPKQQAGGKNDGGDSEAPKPVLGLEDAFVTAGDMERHPVGDVAREEGAPGNTE